MSRDSAPKWALSLFLRPALAKARVDARTKDAQVPAVKLVVTTGRRPSPALRSRAQAVAETIGAPLVRRAGGIASLCERHRCDAAYVVSHQREAILPPSGDALFIHPGLFAQKCAEGVRHPLIRAVVGEQGPPSSLLDATLGQVGDALFIAGVLGPTITGLESSSALHCLQRAGLAQMRASQGAVSAAAARISPKLTDAHGWLQAAPDASVDVVYLDPMMPKPQPAQAGFSLLRALANPAPLSDATVVEAARVAKKRVVMKVAASEPVPTTAIGWHRRLRGSAVHYLVHERQPGALPEDAAHQQWRRDYNRRRDVPPSAQDQPRGVKPSGASDETAQ